MKSFLYMVSGVCAALAYLIVHNRKVAAAAAVAAPVDELAHKLQDAWADHHTVV